jgi:hypothetical protein
MTLALVLLTLAAMFQPSLPRMWAALTFAAFTLLHEFTLSETTGLLYYGSAATFDIMIAYFISRLTPIPASVLPLIRICWLSAFINAVGYFMYLGYCPPGAYDTAMIGVMIAAILAFTYRGGDDVGFHTAHGGRFSIFGTTGARRDNIFKGKGTI